MKQKKRRTARVNRVGFFKTRSKTMIASAGVLVALLVGVQQLGVFNHVDTPAWSSDLLKLAQQVITLTRQQVQDQISFYQYQLNQANAALANNRLAQYGFTSRRQPLPSVLIEQQSSLQAAILDLQGRIAADQSKLNSGAVK